MTPRYAQAFEVPSSSGTRTYRIAYDAAPGAGYWVCSCPAGINRGNCKHLHERGLRGRADGKQPLVAPSARPPRKPKQARQTTTNRRTVRRFIFNDDEV